MARLFIVKLYIKTLCVHYIHIMYTLYTCSQTFYSRGSPLTPHSDCKRWLEYQLSVFLLFIKKQKFKKIFFRSNKFDIVDLTFFSIYCIQVFLFLYWYRWEQLTIIFSLKALKYYLLSQIRRLNIFLVISFSYRQ